MKYNNDWLIARQDSGDRLKCLFFWGHQPGKDGHITQSCFSQWWPAPFTVNGVTYSTAEHWMMAHKASLFGDAAIRAQILNAVSPGETKKLGRQIRDFVPEVWDLHKYRIVMEGNLHKFSQHPALKDFLLGTKDRILVEASPVDPVWGIGLAADHPTIENPQTWRGENLLGYALMEVRDVLQQPE